MYKKWVQISLVSTELTFLPMDWEVAWEFMMTSQARYSSLRFFEKILSTRVIDFLKKDSPLFKASRRANMVFRY